MNGSRLWVDVFTHGRFDKCKGGVTESSTGEFTPAPNGRENSILACAHRL